MESRTDSVRPGHGPAPRHSLSQARCCDAVDRETGFAQPVVQHAPGRRLFAPSRHGAGEGLVPLDVTSP